MTEELAKKIAETALAGYKFRTEREAALAHNSVAQAVRDWWNTGFTEGYNERKLQSQKR